MPVVFSFQREVISASVKAICFKAYYSDDFDRYWLLCPSYMKPLNFPRLIFSIVLIN